MSIDSLDKSNFYIDIALKICKEKFGEKSPRLAQSYNILGRILSREGKFDNANEKYYEALKILKLNDSNPSKFLIINFFLDLRLKISTQLARMLCFLNF